MRMRYATGLVIVLGGLLIASLPAVAAAAPRQRVQCTGVVDASDYLVWQRNTGNQRIMLEWTSPGIANLICPTAPGLNGPHAIRQHVQGVLQADASSCRFQGRQTTSILIGLLLPAVQKFNGEAVGSGPRAGTTCTLNIRLEDKTGGGGSMLMTGQLVFDAADGTIRPAGPLSISLNFSKIE